ncbi:MAG: hypothetical protein QF535_20495 [Anaerolineales bacterium]|nr:hypothetical protein [Anaerolineales bacterium]
MKLLKTVIFVFMVCGFCLAQGKVSPVIAMAWDWDNVANTTKADGRIGMQASIDEDRWYGIDTDGTDHRTFFAWKYAKLGIGIDEDANGVNQTIYTIGATYDAVGGVRTELEYVGNTDAGINPFLRLSLVATF